MSISPDRKITRRDSYSFEPIGILRSAARWRYEAPRQAEFDAPPCEIELFPGKNYETALEDLDGFERIWIIFVFHLNQTWNPKVAPPVTPDNRKYGVFSTRSPHRPNKIGLSCVRLLAVDGRKLLIEAGDMLDGTPVLDIKPYIPQADAFPNAVAGWRDKVDNAVWNLNFRPAFLEKNAFLLRYDAPDMENFCRIQLIRDPVNSARKRVERTGSPDAWIIHCRTWKILFSLHAETHSLDVFDLQSNYRPDELLPGTADKYGDKNLHRAFLTAFPKENPE